MTTLLGECVYRRLGIVVGVRDRDGALVESVRSFEPLRMLLSQDQMEAGGFDHLADVGQRSPSRRALVELPCGQNDSSIAT